MIGNTLRGFNGARLGNQIFQFALLFSLWKRKNQPFFIQRKNEQFWNCFDLDIPSYGQTQKYMGDYGCPYEYYQDIYNLNGGIEFCGYFQNKFYVEPHKQELIDYLKFKKEHSDYVDSKINELKQKYNLPLVSVHFRRGDFVEYSSSEHIWGNLSKSDYYEKCFAKIKEPCVYLIFSDDIPWCKTYFKNINNINNINYMDVDEYKSLCMMTKTNYNIVANSTFSWWGAFLNKNSNVYVPSKWTGLQDRSNCKIHQNFILNEWNSIEVNHQCR